MSPNEIPDVSLASSEKMMTELSGFWDDLISRIIGNNRGNRIEVCRNNNRVNKVIGSESGDILFGGRQLT